MLFRRYNTEKRMNIVICSEEMEELAHIYDDYPTVKTVLENRYKDSILDSPPYHYVIMEGGVFELKPLDLAHNDNSILTAFNDDIRILLIKDSYLVSKFDELKHLISAISAKYSMPIGDRLVFVKRKPTINENQAFFELKTESIKERHKIYPVMSIYEFAIDNSIIINKKIVPFHNRDGYTNIKTFADKYSMPVQILIDLNPHVDSSQLKSTDTIFVPATIAVSGMMVATNALKQTEYTYNKCKSLIVKGVGIDG